MRLISLLFLAIISTSCAYFPIQDLGFDQPQINTNPNDIFVGMDLNSVRRAWGEPRRVFVAGASRDGHQKWVYSGVQAPVGRGPSRIVYFENGQVVGWETLGY